MFTDFLRRYSTWLHLLSFLPALAGARRSEVGVPGCGRDSAWLHAVYDSYVYFWEEGEDVDGSEELHGEVLGGVFLWGLVSGALFFSCIR